MPDQPWEPLLQLALTAAVAIWLATALMRRRLLR